MRTGKVQYISLHAEINTLFKMIKKKNRTASFRRQSNEKYNFNGSTIYVVRLMKKKKNLPPNQTCWYGNAKPCDRCQEFLFRYGVKKVKYTDVRIIDGKEVNVLCEMRKGY